GHVAVGMHRQGFDLQLTQYDERGPARDVLHDVVGLDVDGDRVRSLLLAARRGRQLAYVGRVEWGVRRAVVEEILTRCRTRALPVCRDVDRARSVVWIEPSVVVEVTYSEVMMGRLRDPVLRNVS